MSIALTNSLDIKSGASTVETNPSAAVMSMTADHQVTGPAFMVTLKAGNISGLSLVPGSVQTGIINVSVDLTTGRWSASNGLSGTLAGAALTSLLTSLKNLRNTAETFAVNNAIVAGVQTAW